MGVKLVLRTAADAAVPPGSFHGEFVTFDDGETMAQAVDLLVEEHSRQLREALKGHPRSGP